MTFLGAGPPTTTKHKNAKLHTPPYELQLESFTTDVKYTNKAHTTRTISADHINAYLIIPGLVHQPVL